MNVIKSSIMLQNIKFNFILRHVPLNWLKHSLARTLTIIHTKANPDWQFKFVFFFFSWIVNFSNKMFKFYYLWHCMKLDICVIFSDYTTWLDQKRNAYYFLHFMLRSQFYLITKCYIQLLPNFQKCWMTKNAFSNELYQGFSLRNIWWIRYIDNTQKNHTKILW